MSIYGTRLFGKVDAVPGIGHVATKCFHINFVPLIPTQGWLVTSQAGRGWRGMKIPVSLKSYFVAWGRLVSIVAFAAGIAFTIFTAIDKHPDSTSIAGSSAMVVVGGAVFFGLRKAKFINNASYARACQLVKLAKLPDSAFAHLAQAYGESPVSFGFAPKMPAVTANVTGVESGPIQVEPIPEQSSEPAIVPQAVSPIRPLSESRRHG